MQEFPECKKAFLIYTPVNPTRPSVERLTRIHHYNLKQQVQIFDYIEEECVLPINMQEHGVYRGQNVVQHFNEVYERNKKDYWFICKWDDDIVLPKTVIQQCYDLFFKDPELVGVGLFQTDYGAPNIIMSHPEQCFYGAFSRFYCYRMKNWGIVPVIVGNSSGDPDNAYQITLQAKKHVLNVQALHLDHRACKGNNDLYRVLLDLAEFMMYK